MQLKLLKDKIFLLHYLSLGLAISSVNAFPTAFPSNLTSDQVIKSIDSGNTYSNDMTLVRRDASKWETAMRVGNLVINVSAAALAALTPVACPSTPACVPIVSGLLVTICIGAVIDFIGIGGYYVIGANNVNITTLGRFAFYNDKLAQSSGLLDPCTLSPITMTAIIEYGDLSENDISSSGGSTTLFGKISDNAQFSFKLLDRYHCSVRYDDSIQKIIIDII